MLVRFAIFFISWGVLGYEVLLMRLLSISQWHHFAYMIISLALLGFGASGTFVALTQQHLLPRFHAAFCVNAVLFGLSVVMGFVFSSHVPLNPLEILWDSHQWLYLFETSLLLFFPFLFAANCISLTFAHLRDQIHRIYLFDLVGAGSGALGIVGLLYLLHPLECLKVLSAPGFLAAGLVSLSKRSPKSFRIGLLMMLCGIALPFVWPNTWLSLNVSEYKGLTMALRVPHAHVIAERSSPLGWLAVVESPVIPLRIAPGISLNCSLEPPPQLGVFSDGDAPSPIARFDGKSGSLAYLDCLTSALPYHLLSKPAVLVLGAGGGADVLTALRHEASSIDAVELDPNMVFLVREEFGSYAGDIYRNDRVSLHVAEARGFITGAQKTYDLIQVSLLDSFSASAAGGYALSETYLYTVEALEEYYRHLNPGGLLSITRWLKVPPRDSIKLFATAVAALERTGLEKPEEHLALIRSWRTTTLLVKKGPFSTEETNGIRAFCDARSFDVDYHPGIKAAETNRYNVLDESYLYEGAMAVLGNEREDFFNRYKFFVAPATDDRPYFFHFFKWGTVPEILSLKGRGGLALMEWTYPVLVLALLQGIAFSLVLIVLPLFLVSGSGKASQERVRPGVYFLILGFAFLFIEMAFIQKFILFLSHPLYAASVVLCGFLIFAGLGSGFSSRLGKAAEALHPAGHGTAIAIPIAGIILISLAYGVLLPPLFRHCMSLPDLFKIVISIALIAPLAFCMGMPFPLGLAMVAKTSPAFIPWAWGINGCGSILSAILATILAIHFGFSVVIGFAVLLYALAATLFWKPLR